MVLRSGVFSHHIASSQAVLRSLTGLGLPEKRCTLVYDPIAELPHWSGPVKENGQPLIVAMYSMLIPWKGQEIFLRAISRVCRRIDRPFRTIVGGSEPFGDRGYLARLRQLTTELGLESRVEFTGFDRDVLSRLQETDVLVLASTDPEPGGHIVQEAMMCGVPTVVTDDGGPSEYARNSAGGLVVPRGDVDAMADAIERLLVDRNLRVQTARRGKEYARRAFDPVAIGSQISAIYRDCLNGT
jgi:glycosyltransferase involved in cell wall biosynthesis